MNRQQALDIVTEFVKNPSLIKHMLAVEAGMAAYAKHYGEDEEKWRVAGLLHDFDWEIHPTLEGHPAKGEAILRERGVAEDVIRAIQSHELTGLITTTALVRPSKRIADVKIKSIKKKWKDKSFAAKVNRDEIAEGTLALGVDLWEEHVPRVLKAMQGISEELGL